MKDLNKLLTFLIYYMKELLQDNSLDRKEDETFATFSQSNPMEWKSEFFGKNFLRVLVNILVITS